MGESATGRTDLFNMQPVLWASCRWSRGRRQLDHRKGAQSHSDAPEKGKDAISASRLKPACNRSSEETCPDPHGSIARLRPPSPPPGRVTFAVLRTQTFCNHINQTDHVILAIARCGDVSDLRTASQARLMWTFAQVADWPGADVSSHQSQTRGGTRLSLAPTLRAYSLQVTESKAVHQHSRHGCPLVRPLQSARHGQVGSPTARKVRRRALATSPDFRAGGSGAIQQTRAWSRK